MNPLTAEHAAELAERIAPESRPLLIAALVERIATDAAERVSQQAAPVSLEADFAGAMVLSTHRAAKVICMSPTTLGRLADTGVIPCIQRDGDRTRYFTRESLERYLRDQERETERRRQELLRPLRAVPSQRKAI